MILSLPFIRRPIATTLLAVGLAIAGCVSFYLLPVSSLPQMDFPTIQVQATLPGASPEIMGTSVASPLERQLGRIAGVTTMTSSSTLGATSITVQFDLTRNIDGAARDVQAAINAALSQLPPTLPNNPTYRKINPADAPVVIFSLTSDVYSRGQLYDAASTILQQKFSRVPGVGQVIVAGSALPAVRIELNPNALNNYGIGLTDVANMIANNNVNIPKGQVSVGSDTLSMIHTNDQLFKAAEYEPLIITYKNNSPVRVSDVGYAVDSVDDVRNLGLANGKPAVILVLFKQPGANIIQTVERIFKLLPQIKASIPAAMNLDTVLDRTTTIRVALHDVEITLVLAMLLVILVTYLFLGNIRAMIITGIAVPLSLLGTFSVLKLWGYSLDNLSLMALTISTGFVVDDAVVVLENISRHLEKGVKPLQAALDGASEIGFTVISMSLSLIAVFIPILCMGGIVGRLFFEFAITLSVAVFISMIISLTVTPMMCAYILSTVKPTKQHALTRMLDGLHKPYAKSLIWALRHPYTMLLLTLGTVLLTVFLYIVIPKGFFPQQDTGRLIASIQAEQDISFQAMKKKLAQFDKILRQDPAVQNVAAFTGSNSPGGNTANSGSIFITLKPLNIRKVSADQVINRLRSKLAVVPGATLYMQSSQDLVIGGRQANAQFQYTLTADNLEKLNKWAPLVTARMAKLHGMADINSDQLSHGLQLYVNIDHATASRFGIIPQQIDNELYSAFGQRQVSIMYMPMNQYHVVVEVAPKYWQFPETLKSLYMRSPSGNEVPYSAFLSFTPGPTLLSVNHQGQTPSATISFNLLPGMALGDAVDKVSEAMNKMELPVSVHGSFQGTAQAFQDSLANEVYLILTALLVVYIVLGILYESLVHPITILLTIPSAGVGALFALLISRTDFSIIALIGIILLIGIVKKNAIMMIDFAVETERATNKSSSEAIYQAALLRFRPIMMTTLAALLGAVPLIIGFGLGSELRRPLGIAIAGGLILSQMLTLYTTPVIYLAMENASAWGKRMILGPIRKFI